MKKMINTLQHYVWGSKDALTRLYNITDPDNRPMAELWIGAHTKSSSRVQDDKGNEIALHTLITRDLQGMLGRVVAERFGELPFLFKVLCVNEPLSIQIHPSLSAARAGFIKENQAGIAFNAPNRNYKDANHKPELVFALTPFQAMNGFRTLSSIVSLLAPASLAHPTIATFLAYPDEQHLAKLFSDLLTMTMDQKFQALDVLNTVLYHQYGEPWDTVRMIAEVYPEDSGLFSPLLLNVITLQPDQAMFLFPQTPHAYLKGVALEVMANSDNVLRAGLTPKYIDVPELMANVKFVAKPENALLTVPEQHDGALIFPILVNDFAFSLHALTPAPQALAQDSAAILFCIDGQAIMEGSGRKCTLRPGESVFIAAKDSPITISGSGRLARVYNHCR